MIRLNEQHTIYQLGIEEIEEALKHYVMSNKIDGETKYGICKDDADVEFLVDSETSTIKGVNIINVYQESGKNGSM